MHSSWPGEAELGEGGRRRRNRTKQQSSAGLKKRRERGVQGGVHVRLD
jgi:hypothetical protein